MENPSKYRNPHRKRHQTTLSAPFQGAAPLQAAAAASKPRSPEASRPAGARHPSKGSPRPKHGSKRLKTMLKAMKKRVFGTETQVISKKKHRKTGSRLHHGRGVLGRQVLQGP